MTKAQQILAGSGILLVALLFFFGRTSEPKKALPAQAGKPAQNFNIQDFISQSKQQLSASQLAYLTNIEKEQGNNRPDSAQITTYQAIANFWKDSARIFEPYAFYISEAAKLDNSEKSLTFAAQLFLNNLRGERDEARLNWLTTEAIGLFEKAIAINPNNDDLRIGLGSCYVFGRGKSGDPQQTMKGIQELLAVVRKDSNNMKAQMILGVGGSLSGQYDKAIVRLQKVVEKEPNNLEAVSYLADTYAAKGDHAEAIKWYSLLKRLVNDPHYSKEVDDRIKMLQQ